MARYVCNVRKYRQFKGLTQEELARAVGVRRETILRLENAKYNPSLELAAHLSHVLDEPIDTLFEFSFEWNVSGHIIAKMSYVMIFIQFAKTY